MTRFGIFGLPAGFLLLCLYPVSAPLAETPLPNGFDGVLWGMTASQIQAKVEIHPADSSSGFGYAEHLEEDPDVYVRAGSQGERIEYYFFNGELYKIFVVYDRILYHTRFYDELAGEVEGAFGPPDKTFSEKYFGLDVFHTLWEDSVSTLDLRKGAGFVYQVRIDKERDSLKKKTIARRKSI